MTEYLFAEPYKWMLMSSSLDIGDIGDEQWCSWIEGAHYVSLDLYPNRLPVNVILGVCLP